MEKVTVEGADLAKEIAKKVKKILIKKITFNDWYDKCYSGR